MDFDQLPDDWTTRSITDPEITADALDLFVSVRDRLDGTIYVLLCDERDCVIQPMAIALPPGAIVDGQERVPFQNFAHLDLVDSMLVVVARSGHRRITAGDLAWREAAQRGLAQTSIRFLGAYVVTPDRCMPIPDPGDYRAAADASGIAV